MTINYLIGDATNPIGSGNKIIAHICNDLGAWGKGFVLAISKKWSQPEKYYKEFKNYKGLILGHTQLIPVQTGEENNLIFVANMIAQHGLRNINNPIPLNYDALTACLTILSSQSEMLTASIHMPRIGCGLAGGNWNKIESIIQKTLFDKEIYVYDLK